MCQKFLILQVSIFEKAPLILHQMSSVSVLVMEWAFFVNMFSGITMKSKKINLLISNAIFYLNWLQTAKNGFN